MKSRGKKKRNVSVAALIKMATNENKKTYSRHFKYFEIDTAVMNKTTPPPIPERVNKLKYELWREYSPFANVPQ